MILLLAIGIVLNTACVILIAAAILMGNGNPGLIMLMCIQGFFATYCFRALRVM